jgi:hypothetical protein
VSSFWNKFSKNKTTTGRQTTLQIAPENNHLFGPLETDPETGFPKLPEGLAWRVSRAGTESGSVKLSVAINMEGNWVGFAQDHYIYTGPSAAALKSTSEYLYEKIREGQKKSAEVDSVVGLYPPNSL